MFFYMFGSWVGDHSARPRVPSEFLHLFLLSDSLRVQSMRAYVSGMHESYLMKGIK